MRRRIAAAIVTVAVVSIAGCGSSGTHTQSLSPTAPTSPSTGPVSSPNPSSSAPSSMHSSNGKPIPTPSVTSTAQGAVNAYIAMSNVLSRWDAHPASAKGGDLKAYVTAPALKQFVATYQNLAEHGLAYRGALPANHVKIVTADSASVVISNCQIQSESDPYVEYVVATGKSVPPSGGRGPYLKVVTILHAAGGWRVNSIVTDASTVCRP